ncbi:peptidoglycan-binding domain-containing protein [Streptomyces sp. TRM 70361]|uniref:peptidoglycan-binding domain-containing protein n=1 Tax=Streptomyces sp. TRM 70361 TaxID=3116553 RepID=UPI002E7B115F|nr:peptidoglycan-binding domain-containing protein [Streptomyces sp. TRM 70361]MEE1939864.1 peptidoglycan-binding domain-containing protein [Streptomyces sp. TRM 70361]
MPRPDTDSPSGGRIVEPTEVLPGQDRSWMEELRLFRHEDGPPDGEPDGPADGGPPLGAPGTDGSPQAGPRRRAGRGRPARGGRGRGGRRGAARVRRPARLPRPAVLAPAAAGAGALLTAVLAASGALTPAPPDRGPGLPPAPSVAPSLAPPPPEGAPSFAPRDRDPGVLRQGDSGPAVAELQRRLSRVPDVYPGGAVDGRYGEALARAVARFQEWYGIRGDEEGVYGDDTRRDLEART